jgi:hypothetical protein
LVKGTSESIPILFGIEVFWGFGEEKDAYYDHYVYYNSCKLEPHPLLGDKVEVYASQNCDKGITNLEKGTD